VQNDARHAIVAALVQAGANIEAESEDGGTPLSRALDAGCGEVVRILLEAGAREAS
jgi:ankyrin repeat protein